MNVETNQMVTMSEANQNFSRAARLVDERGRATISKNNRPKYLIIDIEKQQAAQLKPFDEERYSKISKRLMKRNKEAYKELAK